MNAKNSKKKEIVFRSRFHWWHQGDENISYLVKSLKISNKNIGIRKLFNIYHHVMRLDISSDGCLAVLSRTSHCFASHQQCAILFHDNFELKFNGYQLLNGIYDGTTYLLTDHDDKWCEALRPLVTELLRCSHGCTSGGPSVIRCQHSLLIRLSSMLYLLLLGYW